MSVRITYYGVRGSTPSPGKNFIEFGGHTTCVFIETPTDNIIIDAGTGIRVLGNDLLKKKFGSSGGHANILFSHTHWDHIQGLPFFVPIYMPQNRFDIYGETKEIPVTETGPNQNWSIHDVLSMQQNFMYFPVGTKDLASAVDYHVLKPHETLELGGVKVETIRLSHPNSSLGFCFYIGDKKYAFCTDVEHSPEMIDTLAEFAKDAEVIAYDCQYEPKEYAATKTGWGHSTYEVGIQIAQKGNIKNLHMIHHDPMHDDTKLLAMEQETQKLFPNAIMVREGLSIEL
ncbi:MAG: MBL fold metallo-hydrolase [Leptospirales bacterium]